MSATLHDEIDMAPSVALASAPSITEHRRFAFYALLTGVGVGAGGSLMLYGQGSIGLSFPLFTALCIAALLGLARATGRPINRRNLWPLAGSLLFAGWVAVRASPQLMTLNVLMALVLGALALAFLPLRKAIDKSSFVEHLTGAISASLATGFGALPELGAAWAHVRHTGLRDRRALVGVLRGVALALPILLVFTVLLASADAMFNSLASGLVSFDGVARAADHTILALLLAWLALGGFAYGLNPAKGATLESRTPSVPSAADPADVILSDGEVADAPMPASASGDAQARPAKRKSMPILLSPIESGIILGGLVLLFGAFVAVQFQYFFGGADNILRGVFTYAEYARRGFFELLAVSMLTLGLLLFLDWVTIRQERVGETVFRGLALGVVALMGVMIFSASQRMELYEQAYGFTHMRVLPHLFIWAIGALLIAFVLQIFRIREQIFSLGLLLTAIGYLLILNVMNLDLYIAQRNIERLSAGEELDMCYLWSLSVDALPAMLAFMDAEINGATWTDETLDGQIASWLRWKQNELDRDQPTLFSANLARDSARAALGPMEADLPSIGEANWQWCATFLR